MDAFESHAFNEQAIIMHQAGCSIGHLATVHAIRPHDTLVVLGGFKMLYPLFERSMQSNLSSRQKAEIWYLLFKILRTFLIIEPSHVLRLYKNKHLLSTIRSCLIRAGTHSHQLLTKNMLSEVLLIAKEACTYARSQQGELDEFYRRFVFDVILDEAFCDLSYVDAGRKRRGKIFEEVAECLYSMYNEEEEKRN